jgi:hypothetical protein
LPACVAIQTNLSTHLISFASYTQKVCEPLKIILIMRKIKNKNKYKIKIARLPHE